MIGACMSAHNEDESVLCAYVSQPHLDQTRMGIRTWVPVESVFHESIHYLTGKVLICYVNVSIAV